MTNEEIFMASLAAVLFISIRIFFYYQKYKANHHVKNQFLIDCINSLCEDTPDYIKHIYTREYTNIINVINSKTKVDVQIHKDSSIYNDSLSIEYMLHFSSKKTLSNILVDIRTVLSARELRGDLNQGVPWLLFYYIIQAEFAMRNSIDKVSSIDIGAAQKYAINKFVSNSRA